jgi:ATP-dependent RNA helicase DOB1
VKGRVACELNAGDELLITELMFAGFFNDLPVEQVVASLSCFVFQEKADENPKLREELSNCFRQLQEQAKRIAKVMQECKLTVEEETYLKQVNPNMMEITLAWCKGAKFSEVCQMTDIFEGNVVRGSYLIIFRKYNSVYEKIRRTTERIDSRC